MTLRRRFWRGPESEKKRATLTARLSRLHLTIEDVIAEGETVMTRWSCRGTHKGELNGVARQGSSSPSPA